MPQPTASTGEAPPSATDEDRAIRQRVRELTTQVLQQGRVDTEAVRDVVRAVTGQPAAGMAANAAEARELFADAVRALDEALMQSASAAHGALQQLASRGKDFTDNDLKDALVSLRKLETDYAAAAGRVAEAMSGNLRREMMELAALAQNVGGEASARVAGMMGEFASRMGDGASSGLETVRGAGVRMALLASGVLAGVADALRDRSEASRDK
jgi:phage-related tail protein